MKRSWNIPPHLSYAFDRLVAEVNSRSLDALDSNTRAKTEEFLRAETPSWPANHLLEFVTIQTCADAGIPQKLRDLRTEYRVLMDDSLPDSAMPEDTRPVAEQRAEAASLLATVQMLRVKRRALGVMRNVLGLVAISIALVIVWYVLYYIGVLGDVPHPRNVITPCVMAGLVGGLISSLSRLYTVRWRGDVLLSTQGSIILGFGLFLNLFFSMLTGVVFAVVLYAIFASDLIQSPAFPAFAIHGEPNKPAYFDTLMSSGLKSNTDVAKIVVWSFIAGFFERFVPDLLTQVKSRQKSEPSKNG